MSRRNCFKRWVTPILCCLIAWTGLYAGLADAELVDRIIAVVNDEIILLSDLDQALSGIRTTLEKQGYPKSEQEAIINRQRSKIIQQLIQDKLTDQQVKRHNITVKDEDVKATINRIKAANKLTEDELRRALELDGMTYESYFKQVKENLLRSRLVNREVKSKIVITDKEVKAYYDAHPEKYAGSTKFKLRHILLRFPGHAGQAEKEGTLEKMKEIRKRLDAGESFEKLAELYSEAPTASQGGRLGVFGSHVLTREIAVALDGLKENQYTEPVGTDQGYQMFFVEEILSKGGKLLEDATLEIREKLYTVIVDKKFNTWIEDLRKRSHIQILGE